eukprot:GEMP01130285.1.p1 GENE.GEMP01130285.1~~GEMP01130285.1.p1  ORF type:complete len:105 (+),score=7.30 GEMP01130285.1:42-356(+)
MYTSIAYTTYTNTYIRSQLTQFIFMPIPKKKRLRREKIIIFLFNGALFPGVSNTRHVFFVGRTLPGTPPLLKLRKTLIVVGSLVTPIIVLVLRVPTETANAHAV